MLIAVCGDGLLLTSIEARPGPGVTPQQAVFFLSATHPLKPPPVAVGPLHWRREKEEPCIAIRPAVVVWHRLHGLHSEGPIAAGASV